MPKLAILFLISFMLLPARSLTAEQEIVRVTIAVGCNDAALKEQIDSYLRRELREIKDVNVSTDDALLGLVISAVKQENGFWSMAVALIMNEYCGKERVRTLQEIWAYSGGTTDQLKEACQQLVAHVDRKWFQSLRK